LQDAEVYIYQKVILSPESKLLNIYDNKIKEAHKTRLFNENGFLVETNMNRGMVLDALNTMIGIQVFMKGNLEDRSTALPETARFSNAVHREEGITFNGPAGNGAVSKEEDPHPIPSVTIFCDNLVFIADPVLIPAINCSRVVDTENINVFDLKASRFELWVQFKSAIISIVDTV